VSGRLENCEAAKNALLDQVPVTIEVDIPFKMHRFVIGQKGTDVRALMKVHDVHITVPPSEQQSDTIKVRICSMFLVDFCNTTKSDNKRIVVTN